MARPSAPLPPEIGTISNLAKISRSAGLKSKGIRYVRQKKKKFEKLCIPLTREASSVNQSVAWERLFGGLDRRDATSCPADGCSLILSRAACG